MSTKIKTKKSPTGLKTIGAMIRTARERQNITQSEFAKKLKTSQSAIARIESGEQNMTIELLEKINKILGERVITTASSTDDFIIKGGVRHCQEQLKLDLPKMEHFILCVLHL